MQYNSMRIRDARTTGHGEEVALTRRWLPTAVAMLLLVVSRATAQAPADAEATRIEAEVRKALDTLVPKGTDTTGPRFWDRICRRASAAVKPLGPKALPALVVVANDKIVPSAQRALAVVALTELDDEGRHVEDVFAFADAPFFSDVHFHHGISYAPMLQPLSHVQHYLVHFMRQPESFDRLCKLIAKREGHLNAFRYPTLFRLPTRVRVKLWLKIFANAPDELSRARLLCNIRYYVGGSEVDAVFRQVAYDVTEQQQPRIWAAHAWAASRAKKDYDTVYALLKTVEQWNRYPSSSAFRTLAQLDRKRACREFTRTFRGIQGDIQQQRDRYEDYCRRRDAGAKVPANPETPPRPFDSSYDTVLTQLGSESQVLAVFSETLILLEERDDVIPNRDWSLRRLANWGYRDVVPLVLSQREPVQGEVGKNISRPKPLLEDFRLAFILHIDPERVLRLLLAKDDGAAVLRAMNAGSGRFYLPTRLREKYRDQLIAAAEKALRAHAGEIRIKTATHWDTPANAFIVLCWLTPEKAVPYVPRLAGRLAYYAAPLLKDTVAAGPLAEGVAKTLLDRHDEFDSGELRQLVEALMTLRPKAGETVVRKLIAETVDPQRRYHLVLKLRPVAPEYVAAAAARRFHSGSRHFPKGTFAPALVRMKPEPTDAERREVIAAMREEMRYSSESGRLRYALRLAYQGDREGREIVEKFMTGAWNPRSGARSFFAFLRYTATHDAAPRASWARDLWLRGMTEHPEATVRAIAIDAAAGNLGLRGAGGKGYPLVEALIAQLDTKQDWRVRFQAGLVLRKALREAFPTWDTSPFWPVARQTRAAQTLRDWWRKHSTRVTWRDDATSSDPGGYFVLKQATPG